MRNCKKMDGINSANDPHSYVEWDSPCIRFTPSTTNGLVVICQLDVYIYMYAGPGASV